MNPAPTTGRGRLHPPMNRNDADDSSVRRCLYTASGPLSDAEIAARLGITVERAAAALQRLQQQGDAVDLTERAA